MCVCACEKEAVEVGLQPNAQFNNICNSVRKFEKLLTI